MGSPPAPEGGQRRLVFRVGAKNHEMDASRVLEVVRLSHFTRVPHGPQALKGISNLRGRPIPVLSMHKVLNVGDDSAQIDGKTIIYDHGGEIGLLVDDVLRLSKEDAVAPLEGVDELIDAALNVAKRAPMKRVPRAGSGQSIQESENLRSLLSFRVAGQLYGMPLEYVCEVSTFRADSMIIPNLRETVIGMVPMRDTILPLVSLASLMGLEGDRPFADNAHVVVIAHEGDEVGLVVDEIDVIYRLPDHAIDPVPAILQKGRGDAQIAEIGRIVDRKLLMSILSPEKLFGNKAVAEAVSQNAGVKPMAAEPEGENAVEQFLFFQLGEEDYGLPITAVDEVIRVPDEMTRIPGAPPFLMGVINLRGKAVPLIDQRRRFDTSEPRQAAKARAIIITTGELQAGFVVDAVSEVKPVASAALSDAPEFSSTEAAVFDRIAHIEADGRMILVVDPRELLTRAERDVVAGFTAEEAVADL